LFEVLSVITDTELTTTPDERGVGIEELDLLVPAVEGVGPVALSTNPAR